MIRTVPILERGVFDSKLTALTIPDSKSTEVIPDSTNGVIGAIQQVASEAVYIEIYNAGANICYFAIGRDCDAVKNFNGIIAVNQAYSIPTREKITVYSPGGCIIARTFLVRPAGY